MGNNGLIKTNENFQTAQSNIFAFVDVISPCVTFNNHEGSMKSYQYTREHMEPVDIPDFVPLRSEITTEYEDGTYNDVILHDGSTLRLSKTHQDFDPQNRISALQHIMERQAVGEVPTGLFYIEPESDDLHKIAQTVDKPLNELAESELCPGSAQLLAINEGFK